jgi:hypothetical protein
MGEGFGSDVKEAAKGALLTSAAISGCALILGVFLGGPFVVIWAINTLFNTEIAYTALNWMAVVALLAILKASTHHDKR